MLNNALNILGVLPSEIRTIKLLGVMRKVKMKIQQLPEIQPRSVPY